MFWFHALAGALECKHPSLWRVMQLRVGRLVSDPHTLEAWGMIYLAWEVRT